MYIYIYIYIYGQTFCLAVALHMKELSRFKIHGYCLKDYLDKWFQNILNIPDFVSSVHSTYRRCVLFYIEKPILIACVIDLMIFHEQISKTLPA